MNIHSAGGRQGKWAPGGGGDKRNRRSGGAAGRRREEGAEVAMTPADLAQPQRAIQTDVSSRGGHESVGRAISDEPVAAGLEPRHADRFLRSFRVTQADREGYGRGNFKMRASLATAIARCCSSAGR
jgi:hypothetical protein